MADDNARKRLIATLTESGGRLRVRNALNPILWLCGIMIVPSVVGIYLLRDALAPLIVLCVAFLAVVGTALFAFVYLLIKDPDRLHSEEYLLRIRTLDLMEEKGDEKTVSTVVAQMLKQREFLRLSHPPEENK